MRIEVLNVLKITELLEAKGLQRKFVNKKLGLGIRGYQFLRGEWMPKNEARKAALLKSLGEILGADPKTLILTLVENIPA